MFGEIGTVMPHSRAAPAAADTANPARDKLFPSQFELLASDTSQVLCKSAGRGEERRMAGRHRDHLGSGHVVLHLALNFNGNRSVMLGLNIVSRDTPEAARSGVRKVLIWRIRCDWNDILSCYFEKMVVAISIKGFLHERRFAQI